MTKKTGFTLIEVVLAIGVLSIAILALVGLMGPALSSARDAIDANQASGIISKVNTFVQTGVMHTSAGATPMDFNAFAQKVSTGRWELFAYTVRPDPEKPSVERISERGAFREAVNRTEVEGQAIMVVLKPYRPAGDGKLIPEEDWKNTSTMAYLPVEITVYTLPQYDVDNIDAQEMKQHELLSYVAIKNR